MSKLVPFLRFPEFKDSGEWVEKKLGEVFKVTRGNVLSMSLVHEISNSDYQFPVYSSQTKNNGLSGYYNHFLFEDAITWTTDGANAGDVNFRSGKFYCTNVCGVLINEEGYSNACIAAMIDAVSRTYVSYVGNPKLMNGVMAEIKINFPSLPEQTKIATFLTSIDERIEALSEQLELTRDYKKGMMQRIFSQELRFKDDEGNEYPEWVEKKLGEVCNITIGEFIIKTKQNPGAEYPVYNGGKTNTGFYEDYNNKGNKVIISARGANAGFVNFEKNNYWAGNSCYSIDVLDKKLCNIVFLYFYIKFFENKFTDFQQSANIPSVSKKDVIEFIASIPHLEEQTKIATFLSSIDERIEALSEQLEQTKLFKKAMLQRVLV
jgi:type I restriction enzyme S subunit